MNILIAMDSFKDSISSFKAASAVERGIKRRYSDAHIVKTPLADGGEGTVRALVSTLGGDYFQEVVKGPLGKPVCAEFGITKDNIAIIEMAEASGLTLMEEDKRNPFKTTSYGTGELIKAALNKGVKEIFIGIGGSGTNDGGIGMAQALGAEFKDENNIEIGFGAEAIENLNSISKKNLDCRLSQVKINVISDVTNVLLGKEGASYVFGSQKGASDQELKNLDNLLKHYNEQLFKYLKIDISNKKGSGAAGGLGGGLLAFTRAEIKSGIENMLDLIEINKHLKNCDLIITGEGRIDGQSVYGKTPIGVAKRAKSHSVPVIALVGSEEESSSKVYDHGIDLIESITTKPMALEEAIKLAEPLLEKAGEKVIRILQLQRYRNFFKEESAL